MLRVCDLTEAQISRILWKTARLFRSKSNIDVRYAPVLCAIAQDYAPFLQPRLTIVRYRVFIRGVPKTKRYTWCSALDAPTPLNGPSTPKKI